MEIGERIKEARRAKNLTQQAMADAIGLKRNTVATYEMGKAVPSDRTIADICREFDISEEWLRDGTGDMFIKRTRDEELAAFFGDVLAADDFRARLLSVMSRLSTEEWALLEQMAQKLVEEQKKPDQ